MWQGETRSATRALKMAASDSEALELTNGSNSNSTEFQEVEDISNIKSTGKPSLQEQAASISNRIAAEKEKAGDPALDSDARDANKVAKSTSASRNSSRSTRSQDKQNGDVNKAASSGRGTEKSSSSRGSSSGHNSSRRRKNQSDENADVLTPILNLQEKTLVDRQGASSGQNKPPPKKKSRSDSGDPSGSSKGWDLR